MLEVVTPIQIHFHELLDLVFGHHAALADLRVLVLEGLDLLVELRDQVLVGFRLRLEFGHVVFDRGLKLLACVGQRFDLFQQIIAVQLCGFGVLERLLLQLVLVLQDLDLFVGIFNRQSVFLQLPFELSIHLAECIVFFKE